MWLELYIVGTLVMLITTAMQVEYIQLGKRKWTRWIGAFLWPVFLPISFLALFINMGILSERVAKAMGMKVIKT